MQHDVIEPLEALLRDEGFTNLTTLRASHDVTISAAKGDTRLVTHVSDRVPVPSHGVPAGAMPGLPGRAGGSGLTRRR